MAEELPVAQGRGEPNYNNMYPHGICTQHNRPKLIIAGIKTCPVCYQKSQGDTRAPDQRGKTFTVKPGVDTKSAFKLVKKKGPDDEMHDEYVYDKELAKGIEAGPSIQVTKAGEVVPPASVTQAPLTQTVVPSPFALNQNDLKFLIKMLDRLSPKNKKEARDIMRLQIKLEGG